MQFKSFQMPSSTIVNIFIFSLLIQCIWSRSIPQRRDAYTTVTGDNSNEGEAHGPIVAPSGSTFTSLNVGTGGEQIAAFWTANPNNAKATQAFIMIHGRERDGGNYWTILNTVLQSALQNTSLKADPNSIVVAPEFFSTKYNSGQYTNTELAWGDVNTWQAGDIATHPSGTTLTSFDALDALVDEFADSTKYPAMKNITVVGHGGGGQLNQRYAMVAKNSPPNVHIRYIHGDPSSCAHFTNDRPTKMTSGYSLPTKASCSYYDTWRYGFTNFTGTINGLLSPQQYFQQYITRDVISIVGLQDIDTSGDTTCMANIMGGSIRRDRNLAWWQYVNILARTNENLFGFPATYDPLPDYSNISKNIIQLQLVVVENADHDAGQVFGSSEGQATLFSTGKAPTGWRPAGWTATTSNASGSSGSNSPSTTSSSSSSSSSGSTNSASNSSSSLAMSALTIIHLLALASGFLCLL